MNDPACESAKTAQNELLLCRKPIAKRKSLRKRRPVKRSRLNWLLRVPSINDFCGVVLISSETSFDFSLHQLGSP